MTLLAADEKAASKEVTAAVETWRNAMLKGDAATLNKLLHPDLIYTHSSAKTETKAENIANATKPDGISKSIEFHDAVVHVYGNTGIYKAKGEFTSAAGTVSHLDVLMVWVKTPNGWQMVARQATKLP